MFHVNNNRTDAVVRGIHWWPLDSHHKGPVMHHKPNRHYRGYCMYTLSFCSSHGPLTRYAKLRVAHAPGMAGTFSPPPRVSDPVMHHGTCVTHMPWCMPASLTSGFLWSRWRGKRARHSRRMRNPQRYVSGMRPITARINSLWTSDTT